MAWFDRKHFEGKIKIAGVDIFAVLESQVYRDWDSEQNIPWESWHYHLTMTNEKSDKMSGYDAKDKPECHVPYISETGFRSDFFQYEKKPADLNMKDVKHIIEGRIKAHLGGVITLLESSDIKPVEVIDKIPEESWVDKDD